jgi:hypothetical protein
MNELTPDANSQSVTISEHRRSYVAKEDTFLTLVTDPQATVLDAVDRFRELLEFSPQCIHHHEYVAVFEILIERHPSLAGITAVKELCLDGLRRAHWMNEIRFYQLLARACEE